MKILKVTDDYLTRISKTPLGARDIRVLLYLIANPGDSDSKTMSRAVGIPVFDIEKIKKRLVFAKLITAGPGGVALNQTPGVGVVRGLKAFAYDSRSAP